MNNKVLTAMGFIMLIGFITIGFFIFPIGIPVCAVVGLGYGIKYKERLFIKWSSVALLIGLVLLVYTWGLIQSM